MLVKNLTLESINLTSSKEAATYYRAKSMALLNAGVIPEWPSVSGRSHSLEVLSESREYDEIHPIITNMQTMGVNTISTGDKISVLDLDVIFAQKYIELRGFTIPKVVTDIKSIGNKIKHIEFADGSHWPQFQPAEFKGRPLEYFIFYRANGASKALTYLTVSLPDGWEIDSDVQ